MLNGKKHILWVDDEIEFLRAHIMFLEEHNYAVTKAMNGDDALALIRANEFDMVFLDEQMPGKDGLTTLEEIKRIQHQLPVVMVTKSEEEQLMEEALGRNINGYLTKPVNPSQILSVCKGILHSRAIKKTRITSDYVREYAAYKAKFMTRQTPQDWGALYHSLCRWDLNLHTLKDQGLEATHENHRKEAAVKFVRFVEENYVSWNSERNPNPYFVTHTYKRKVIPHIKEGRSVCSLVMTGFRLDQWLILKDVLEPYFEIDESVAWAPLPTDSLYCRSALLAGKSPREISLDHPQLWNRIESGEEADLYLKELLKVNLASNGVRDFDDPILYTIRSAEESASVLQRTEEFDAAPLVTLVVEFAELLLDLRKESSLLREIAPDELGFRELTRMWFESSNLLKLMKHFAAKGREVVLSSDHGSIFVTVPVEVFCQQEKTPHPRVKVGKGISCDERHVFFVESPSNYGLPGDDGQTGYAIAKQHIYFTYPNKYQYFGTQFKNQMVSGGLSMEEMLVPLASMSPRASQ